MEHPRIDDEAILDRYVAGRLPEAEEALFEEHLFECTVCLEQVQAADELRRGLRVVATEDAARATAAVGLLALWRGSSSARRLGLATMGLLVALLPAALVWRYAESRPPGHDETQVAAAGDFARPLSALQVVSLGVVRSAEDNDAATAVRTDPSKDGVMLSLELPPSKVDHYRVTILDETGAMRWQGDELTPNLYDTLVIVLPSTFLAPGRYRVVVESRAPGESQQVGEILVRFLD